MRYATEDYPYGAPTALMTPGALKKAFAIVLESRYRRIGYISDFLYKAHGLRLSIDSSDEDLDKLPIMIAKVGGLSDLTDEEREARLVGTKPEFVDMARAILPSQELTPQTLGMVFDGALLWGEVFKARYPSAEWAIGKKPKSSFDYGHPVLVGVDKYRSEFAPKRHLHGFVGRALLNAIETRTLSGVMKVRACGLGLVTEPSSSGESVTG